MKVLYLYIAFLVFFKAEAQSSALAIADSLYTTGNYTKAINSYAEEGSPKANLQIARAYNAVGNFEKAIVQYQSVVQQHPDWHIATFELGKLFIKTKTFDEARKLFSALSATANDNPEYHYYLGEAFRELDQPSSSLVSYKKAITVDSTHLKSLFQLGKYFVIKRETIAALKYLDMGLRYYENDVSLLNLKALALFNNDAYGKARPYFERLLQLGENKPHVYGKLAYCYYKEWEFEKAKETYHKLIRIDENEPDPYFNLGHVFYRDRQVDSARFYIQKSVEVQKPSFHREYRSLANFAREEDDLKTALEYYKKAYDEEPANYMTYYQICAVADQLYEDPKVRLQYYENFIQKFGEDKPYVSATVKKRISQLKEEMHFAKD